MQQSIIYLDRLHRSHSLKCDGHLSATQQHCSFPKPKVAPQRTARDARTNSPSLSTPNDQRCFATVNLIEEHHHYSTNPIQSENYLSQSSSHSNANATPLQEHSKPPLTALHSGKFAYKSPLRAKIVQPPRCHCCFTVQMNWGNKCTGWSCDKKKQALPITMLLTL